MKRPDLAFSFLSKFLQYPGEAHLAAAYRVLAYVNGTLHQGLSWHDPGAGSRNKLSGWVDSDFASDIDTCKSMTGYLMVLNVGPISWKASGLRRAVVRRSSSLLAKLGKNFTSGAPQRVCIPTAWSYRDLGDK